VQIISSKKLNDLQTQIKALQTSTMMAQVSTVSQTIYPVWHVLKEIEAYRVIDDVYSVVNRLARTAAMIPFTLYYPDTDEDVEFDNPAAKLFRTFTLEKKIELYTHLFLTGECFFYKELYIGADARVESLDLLHSSFMTLKLNRQFPFTIAAYEYQDANAGVIINNIPKEEVAYIKYPNPSPDWNYSKRGLSPILVLAQTLTRLQAGRDASVAQMQNGGVPGILTVKDLRHDTTSKPVIGAIKDNIARFMGNSNNKGAPIIMPGDMNYIPLGLKLADMEVADLAAIDFKKICNAYSVSDVLFNNDSSSTESNVKEMVRLMYTNAVLPVVMMVRDCFNNEVLPYFSGRAVAIKYDVSEVTELQADMKAKADVFAALPVMIPNDVLEAFGYQRDERPEMDMPFIKSGYSAIDDFEPLPDIE
jgi:HK97 family phage portal protein